MPVRISRITWPQSHQSEDHPHTVRPLGRIERPFHALKPCSDILFLSGSESKSNNSNVTVFFRRVCVRESKLKINKKLVSLYCVFVFFFIW